MYQDPLNPDIEISRANIASATASVQDIYAEINVDDVAARFEAMLKNKSLPLKNISPLIKSEADWNNCWPLMFGALLNAYIAKEVVPNLKEDLSQMAFEPTPVPEPHVDFPQLEVSGFLLDKDEENAVVITTMASQKFLWKWKKVGGAWTSSESPSGFVPQNMKVEGRSFSFILYEPLTGLSKDYNFLLSPVKTFERTVAAQQSNLPKVMTITPTPTPVPEVEKVKKEEEEKKKIMELEEYIAKNAMNRFSTGQNKIEIQRGGETEDDVFLNDTKKGTDSAIIDDTKVINLEEAGRTPLPDNTQNNTSDVVGPTSEPSILQPEEQTNTNPAQNGIDTTALDATATPDNTQIDAPAIDATANTEIPLENNENSTTAPTGEIDIFEGD